MKKLLEKKGLTWIFHNKISAFYKFLHLRSGTNVNWACYWKTIKVQSGNEVSWLVHFTDLKKKTFFFQISGSFWFSSPMFMYHSYSTIIRPPHGCIHGFLSQAGRCLRQHHTFWFSSLVYVNEWRRSKRGVYADKQSGDGENKFVFLMPPTSSLRILNLNTKNKI